MYPQYEDKGKIFTDVVRTTTTRVLIQTTANTSIHGYLHTRLDNRLKDELNDDEPFIAITDAVLLDAQGKELYRSGFLAVNRAQIVYVLPLDKETTENMESEQ